MKLLPEQQRAIAGERRYCAKIDEKTKDIPGSEQEVLTKPSTV